MGIIVIGITMLGILTFKATLRNKTTEIEKFVGQTHDILHESASLKVSYQNIILHERGYLLTGEEDEILQINKDIDTLMLHYNTLHDLTKNHEGQQENLTRLMQGFKDLQTRVFEPMLQMRTIIVASPENFIQGFQFADMFNRTATFTSEQFVILDAIEQEAHRQLLVQREALETWYAYDAVLSLLGPIVILLVTFLTGLLSVRKIKSYKREQEEYQQQLKDSRDRYSNVIEGANVGTWEWLVQENNISINEKWAEMLGYTPAELQPLSFDSWGGMIHPEDYTQSLEKIQQTLTGEREIFSVDLRMKCKDGSWVWIHTQGKIISRSLEGKPLLITGTNTNISERMEAQIALKKSEENSRLLIDSMDQGLAHCEVIFDEVGKPSDIRFIMTNPSFEQYIGAPRGGLIDKTLLEVMPDAEDYWIDLNAEVARTGKPISYEKYSRVLDKYFSAYTYCPNPNQFAIILDNITERKLLEQQVFYEKELFETTLLSVGDGVISTDELGKVSFMNKVAETLTGWRTDEAKGRPFAEIFKIVSGRKRSKCPDPVAQVLEQRQAVGLLDDTILVARDGVERYIDDSASPIMDKDKTIKGVVLVFRDSTEKKREQDKMLQLSYRDSLTGLYNRRYYEQIKQTVDSEPYYPLTLVIGDVNGLKLTNDAFGHDAGDQLLKKVAAVFRKTCREGDIITRFGGDEFVLLLPKTDAIHAKIIVNRLQKALLSEEIRGLSVSVSFGYSVKNGEPMPFEEAFKLAEDGMYLEKLSKSLAFKKHAIDTLLVKQFELSQWEKEHSIRVGKLSKRFAQVMGFTKEEVWQIERGASLHDLGKIAVDETILSQKENLTQSQWLELKRHPEIGYTILRSVGEYAPFAEYVLYHHERWDGEGYPQKLKGPDIPQPARMIAIVDSYVAMVSDRGYKRALTHQEAIEELYACRGTQFDPELVPIFVHEVLLSDFQKQSEDV